MINLNVVTRIAEDKNFFPDLVEMLYRLKKKEANDVHILFIGEVYSQAVYQNIIDMAGRFNVSSNIAFTEKSVPMHELSEEIKNGYFINFTIGEFTGYSGLEGIKSGFKTIFYNIDKTLENERGDLITYCRTLDELAALVLNISQNQATVNQQIIACNQEMVNRFVLNSCTKQQLLSMMLPGSGRSDKPA
jgi:hypothetical protein